MTAAGAADGPLAGHAYRPSRSRSLLVSRSSI